MNTSNLLHPSVIIERLRWNFEQKKLKYCGKNVHVGAYFSFGGAQYISIGNNCQFGRNAVIRAYDSYQGKSTGYLPNLNIGSNVSMMDNCQISCANMVQIGDGVLFGDNVFITDNFHGINNPKELSYPPLNRQLSIGGPVVIGNNVWVGRNVCIMPGVRIGSGAVIGANAVVCHNIQENTVAAGVPARIIRTIQ